MGQRALLTVVVALTVLAVGVIAPVAGSDELDVPAEVVDAEVRGLPTATDERGQPVVEAARTGDRHRHAAEQNAAGSHEDGEHDDTDQDARAHEHASEHPVGAAGGVRSEAVETPIAFSMVAFEVPRGAGVSFRARTDDRPWDDWHAVEVHPDEAPDPDSAEAEDAAAPGAGRSFSEPVWVGEADRLQIRVDGAAPEDVGVHLVDSRGHNRDAGERISDTVTAVARAMTGGNRPAAATVDRPDVVTREGWGADESKRSGSPSYAHRVGAGVLHHTVTGNDYDRGEAPSVIRAIYHYHTRTRGWSDIGYNFLIDRFGTIYQGRAGGMEEPVIGAHAAGYNAGSAGVAFLGTHTSPSGTSLAAEAEASAVELLQWLFDVHHIDAEIDGWVGGEFIARVVGHGDVGSTDCPGGYVRQRMDAVRREVIEGQVPMFTAPAESSTQLEVGEDLTVSAGLKPAGEWELAIRHEDDGLVHAEDGSGEELSVTVQVAQPGTYEWVLSSPGRRSASGEVAVTDEVAERVGGDGPIGGAVELSQLAFPQTGTARHAVVTRADVFADAMAGGPLAGADGPLLLTPSGELDPRVAEELERVLPEGETVYILGGDAAISERVASRLEQRWEVERFAGRERTETAALIAHEVLDRSGERRAMLARSAPDDRNPWADALAGSGWGARGGVPVLLTPTDRLTGPTEEALERVETTIVLGGTLAVSDDVAAEVPSPRRVAGGDRASTAAAIAEQLWGRTSGADGDVLLVGAGWYDGAWQRALASAPLAAREGAPLLLTASDRVSGPTADYLQQMGYGGDRRARGWVLEDDPIIEMGTWTELNLLMQ